MAQSLPELTASDIPTLAFTQALLRTERLRICGSILVTAAFGITGAIRIYLFGSHMKHSGIYYILGFALYEVLVLRLVQRSLRTGMVIPNWLWTLNVAIEMSVPAVAFAFFVSDRIAPEYRPLASPWVLLFFPFLLLSTLRLSALVSSFAGITGAIGYLLAAMYNGWHIKPDLHSNSVAHSAVLFFAVVICIMGFVAGLVGREIRVNVEAALREADKDRLLKQMEHDLAIARSIQQSLLPKVRPDIEGYEIAGWNRSADATGGDYFDWQQLEDGSLVVTLADVTGHGMGPALLASVCRAYARASFNPVDSLATTVQRINHSLMEDLSPGRFATFIAAVCRSGDDNLELLSAGHGPFFVYSCSTHQLQAFPAHDVPLGILPHLTSVASQVVSMQLGDVILLVTDGFFEWENAAGEQFGIARLQDFVSSHCHLGPEEIIAGLYERVLEFAAGTPQQDDLTAVVIKKTGTHEDPEIQVLHAVADHIA